MRSAHDLSDGGLGVALAEPYSQGPGATIDLGPAAGRYLQRRLPTFSESASRFILSVRESDLKQFEKTSGTYPTPS
jgi:phosphoribosylformylglycinamidine (FGAM) synthase-like enzyme